MNISILMTFVPLVLVALVVMVLVLLVVGRPKETRAATASRPINRWGVAYFCTAAIVGVLLVIVSAAAGNLPETGSLLCIYPVLAVIAPFLMVALFRALRAAGIL